MELDDYRGNTIALSSRLVSRDAGRSSCLLELQSGFQGHPTAVHDTLISLSQAGLESNRWSDPRSRNDEIHLQA
jgi:hypothetical protein